MYSNMKSALSVAMILGATCIAPADKSFAQGSYNFEPGVASSEWIIQGDTWIRREELIGSAYPGKTKRLVPSGKD
jgi:hypothetical protein